MSSTFFSTKHFDNLPVLHDVKFGEATPQQRILCYQLAATFFREPLTAQDHCEREAFLSEQPLTKDTGWRFWCLTPENDPNQVLASCKTMHRDLLIRDVDGVREEQGYCVATVITDSKYRNHGLATFLLENVSRWMDGSGGAEASTLYSDVGTFYVKRGWKSFPAFHMNLVAPHEMSSGAFSGPKTDPLLQEDIADLCLQDCEVLRSQFRRTTLESNEIQFTFLPTHDLVSWLHARAEFISAKINDRAPTVRGSICPGEGIWVYWFHDFREQYLAIQRIAVSAETAAKPWNTDLTRALAKLLLDAVVEARSEWQLSRVVVWSPDERVDAAAKLLNDDMRVEVTKEERKGEHLPSVRWKGADESRKITLQPNEFYAWA